MAYPQMPQGLPAQPEPGASEAPQGPSAPPSMAGLLGQGGGATAPAPVTPEKHAEELLGQFRELSMQLQALARQYPAAQQDLAVANDALISAMTKVVSALSAESSSAPPVLM